MPLSDRAADQSFSSLRALKVSAATVQESYPCLALSEGTIIISAFLRAGNFFFALREMPKGERSPTAAEDLSLICPTATPV